MQQERKKRQFKTEGPVGKGETNMRFGLIFMKLLALNIFLFCGDGVGGGTVEGGGWVRVGVESTLSNQEFFWYRK